MLLDSLHGISGAISHAGFRWASVYSQRDLTPTGTTEKGLDGAELTAWHAAQLASSGGAAAAAVSDCAGASAGDAGGDDAASSRCRPLVTAKGVLGHLDRLLALHEKAALQTTLPHIADLAVDVSFAIRVPACCCLWCVLPRADHALIPLLHAFLLMQLPLPKYLVDGRHLTFVTLTALLRHVVDHVLGSGTGAGAGAGAVSEASAGDAVIGAGMAGHILHLLQANLSAVLASDNALALSVAGLRPPSLVLDSLLPLLVRLVNVADRRSVPSVACCELHLFVGPYSEIFVRFHLTHFATTLSVPLCVSLLSTLTTASSRVPQLSQRTQPAVSRRRDTDRDWHVPVFPHACATGRRRAVAVAVGAWPARWRRHTGRVGAGAGAVVRGRVSAHQRAVHPAV